MERRYRVRRREEIEGAREILKVGLGCGKIHVGIYDCVEL